MFTSIRLHNFKGWEDTGDVRLAPITLFFGSNSSGKTSLLQSLLLLEQTAASSDRSRVLHPGDERSLVDLGTASDLMHGHAGDGTIEVGIGWTLPDAMDLPVAVDVWRSVQSLGFSTQVRLTPDGQPYVSSLIYEAGDVAVGMEQRDGGGAYNLITKGIRLKRRPGRAWPLPQPVRFYGFPDETANYFQDALWLSDLVLALEKQLDRIQYVGHEMGDLAAMAKVGIRRRRAG